MHQFITSFVCIQGMIMMKPLRPLLPPSQSPMDFLWFPLLFCFIGIAHIVKRDAENMRNRWTLMIGMKSKCGGSIYMHIYVFFMSKIWIKISVIITTFILQCGIGRWWPARTLLVCKRSVQEIKSMAITTSRSIFSIYTI